MFRKILVASIVLGGIVATAFSGSIVSAFDRTFSAYRADDGTYHATHTRTFHRNCAEVTVETHRVYAADCDCSGRGRLLEATRTVTRGADGGSCSE